MPCLEHHWHVASLELAVPERPTCGVSAHLHVDFVVSTEWCCRCSQRRDIGYEAVRMLDSKPLSGVVGTP